MLLNFIFSLYIHNILYVIDSGGSIESKKSIALLIIILLFTCRLVGLPFIWPGNLLHDTFQGPTW